MTQENNYLNAYDANGNLIYSEYYQHEKAKKIDLLERLKAEVKAGKLKIEQ